MKTCATCEKQLGPRNRSGYCCPCLNRVRNSDPEFRAKLSAGMRRSLAMNPELKDAYRQRAIALRDLPQTKEAKRRRWMAEKPWVKGNECRPAGSDARRRAAARQSATLLADVPANLRPLYRELTRLKGLSAAEARDLVAAQDRAELTRFRAAVGAAIEIDPAIYEPSLPGCAVAATAVLLGLEVEAITSASRSPPLVDARAVIAVALRRAEYSYPKIGRRLNRDHSAVIHLVETFPKRVSRRPELAVAAERLTARLAA